MRILIEVSPATAGLPVPARMLAITDVDSLTITIGPSLVAQRTLPVKKASRDIAERDPSGTVVGILLVVVADLLLRGWLG